MKLVLVVSTTTENWRINYRQWFFTLNELKITEVVPEIHGHLIDARIMCELPLKQIEQFVFKLSRLSITLYSVTMICNA